MMTPARSSTFENIHTYWKEEFKKVATHRGLSRLAHGEFSEAHYASLLRELFFYVRENAPIQASFTIHLRGEDKKIIAPMLRHAYSESNEDDLILHDLRALGYSTDGIESKRPLPATTSLIAYTYYQAHFANPIGYLGALFHKEFNFLSTSKDYLQQLAKAGIPEEATSFIEDHAHIDIAHQKLLEKYIEVMVRSDSDIQEIKYAISVSVLRWSELLTAAFAQGDLWTLETNTTTPTDHQIIRRSI
jgi:pyrroloquinoline quinone (PQQ) biosynthesis protein C